MYSEYDYLFKILLIGDSGTGKSCMLLRFADDTFNESHISTIGVDFKIRTVDINNKTAKLQIWDTAGQERFRTITSSYYRGAHAIMIIYDVSDLSSFNNIKTWFLECDRYGSDDTIKVLIGNKIDTMNRTVSYDMGREFADSLGIKFVETSAKTNLNIERAFMTVTELLYDQQKNKIAAPNSNTTNLIGQPVDKLYECC